MARIAKLARATKASATTRPRGRPPGSKNKVKTTAKATAAPTRGTAVPKRTAAVPRPPVVTKDELRAQVEKLERANATLRTKNREAARAFKAATARIETLEAQVAKLERAAIPKEVPARTNATTPKPKPARATRGRRPSGHRDPGDAVPPGVAVQEPEPMDMEAKTAFENLEEHLSGSEMGGKSKE